MILNNSFVIAQMLPGEFSDLQVQFLFTDEQSGESVAAVVLAPPVVKRFAQQLLQTLRAQEPDASAQA